MLWLSMSRSSVQTAIPLDTVCATALRSAAASLVAATAGKSFVASKMYHYADLDQDRSFTMPITARNPTRWSAVVATKVCCYLYLVETSYADGYCLVGHFAKDCPTKEARTCRNCG